MIPHLATQLFGILSPLESLHPHISPILWGALVCSGILQSLFLVFKSICPHSRLQSYWIQDLVKLLREYRVLCQVLDEYALRKQQIYVHIISWCWEGNRTFRGHATGHPVYLGASLEVVASVITIVCWRPCLFGLFQYVIVVWHAESVRTSFRKWGTVNIILPSLSFPFPCKGLEKGMRGHFLGERNDVHEGEHCSVVLPVFEGQGSENSCLQFVCMHSGYLWCQHSDWLTCHYPSRW